jgi:hypothetical protein
LSDSWFLTSRFSHEFFSLLLQEPSKHKKNKKNKKKNKRKRASAVDDSSDVESTDDSDKSKDYVDELTSPAPSKSSDKRRQESSAKLIARLRRRLEAEADDVGEQWDPAVPANGLAQLAGLLGTESVLTQWTGQLGVVEPTVLTPNLANIFVETMAKIPEGLNMLKHALAKKEKERRKYREKMDKKRKAEQERAKAKDKAKKRRKRKLKKQQQLKQQQADSERMAREEADKSGKSYKSEKSDKSGSDDSDSDTSSESLDDSSESEI